MRNECFLLCNAHTFYSDILIINKLKRMYTFGKRKKNIHCNLFVHDDLTSMIFIEDKGGVIIR